MSKRILVTGARGFIGRNIVCALNRIDDVEVVELGSEDFDSKVDSTVEGIDFVIHLAGVNRPPSEDMFHEGNVGCSERLCQALKKTGVKVPLIYTSTTQVDRENAYGKSKRQAEDMVMEYSRSTGAPVYVYRLPNVFGKWSRPEYNTVVATFCHNISRGLPVQVNDSAAALTLAYVDDVVACFLDVAMGRQTPEPGILGFDLVENITLGELHDQVAEFEALRRKERVPDMSNPFTRKLYATFESFLDPEDLSYPVDLKTDDRGWLFELIKSPAAGQIFVSTTKPGITRGDHFHHSKVEKFCVIQGDGIIRFREVDSEEIREYRVNGENIRAVHIPPGQTHSIENCGSVDMLTIFWANEIFDPEKPDTYFEKVINQPS